MLKLLRFKAFLSPHSFQIPVAFPLLSGYCEVAKPEVTA